MTRPWTRRLAVGSVTVVALVAAVVSYAHMWELAERSGEQWRAWLFPLSVDGMLLAATLAIVDRRRAGLRAGWVPWAGLVLGIGASLVANVAAAEPTLTAQAVAAWPPLALAISIETLVIVLRGTPAPEPLLLDAVPDWWADADLAPAEPSAEHVPDPVDVESAEERAARLLAEGAGRRRLARELDITEHAARELIATRRDVETTGATR